MSVRYALSSTPYSREFRAKFATLCCAFANASDSVRHADSRIWREVRMNSSLSFHSQEQWHSWLPDPKATHVRKRFRPAGHTNATAQSGTGRHVTLYVPSSSAGAIPGDAFPQPPVHPPPQTPWSSQTPWRGRGTRPTPPPPIISSLSMLRSQPPFAWKLDLPGRKRAREDFVATTWEVEVETQDGQREPPLKMSFPYDIAFPNPGGGWKEGRRLLPSTHPGCVEGIGDWIVA